MRKSVLMYEDEPIALKNMARLLEQGGLFVIKARHLAEAAESLLSSHPPAVFITDLAFDLWINDSVYEEIRRKHNFESENYGNTGVLALINDVQEQQRDVRIIFNSGMNTGETATRIGAFAYMVKPINEDKLHNLIEVCRLGPLRSDELDETQKLKGGPFDIEASWSLKPYIERFWAAHQKERK